MTDKVTVATLRGMKREGEKIACLTAYDAGFARLLDNAGIELILVGDSLGMALQGGDSTLKVKMSDMIYHSRITSAGRRRALLVTDLPFMSYATPAQALGNAARLVSDGGAEVVKLEGGREVIEAVSLLSARGIAVCGHLGLTPQSVHKLGGYRIQGRAPAEAEQIRSDARALQDAGAVLLVLECIPAGLAAEISRLLTIPVIGIGAGAGCDGQVLVLHDMLGITEQPNKFSKVFLDGQSSISAAIERYIEAVKSGAFPAVEHQFS